MYSPRKGKRTLQNLRFLKTITARAVVSARGVVSSNRSHNFPPLHRFLGIQCSCNLDEMKGHLQPILNLARGYLQTATPPGTPANTDFYLLATGGMRTLGQTNPLAYNSVLADARGALDSLQPPFPVDPSRIQIRTITGQQEGWFAWSEWNYGRERTDTGFNTMGILDMGGATLQYAYKVAVNRDGNPDVPVQDRNRVGFICTGQQDPAVGDNVYSHEWNMGADMLKELVFHDGKAPNISHDNPCLPTGEDITVGDVQSKGTGNFEGCFTLLNDIFRQQLLPNLTDIPASPGTDQFLAVASFQHSYKFFSNTDSIHDNTTGAKYNPLDPGGYNRTAFRAAVEGYCQSNWADISWAHNDEHRDTRCLNAVWLWRTFDNDPIPDRPVYFISKPSWTQGAAALISNHSGLRLCGMPAELPPYEPPEAKDLDGNANVSFDQTPQNLALPASAQPAPITSTPFAPTMWAYYLSFAVLFILITRRLVQRSRPKALGTISLQDLEGDALAVGEKVWEMEDQGLGGFYKN